MPFSHIMRRFHPIYRRYFPHFFLLTLVTTAAYLPYIANLGFYHDDWQYVFARSAGQDIKYFFSVDRPFMGTILAKSAMLLGYKAVLWQLYAFLMRLAGGFAFYLLAEEMLPVKGGSRPALLAALLFLVYPGFLMQPSAVSYVPHLLALLLAIVSIYLSVKSLQFQHVSWKGLACSSLLVFLSAALVYPYLAILEYFIGLESIRLVLLAARLSNWREKRARAQNLMLIASRAFLPLLAAAAFLYWRFWVFVPKRVAVDSSLVLNLFAERPFEQGVQFLLDTVNSLFQTLILAFVVPLFKGFFGLELWQIILNVLLALIMSFSCWWFLHHKFNDLASGFGWQRSWLTIGVVSAVLPLLPPVLLGRPVDLTSDYNRYTLQSIPGVAIALVGLICLLRDRWRNGLFTLLIAVSMTTQLNNGAHYAQLWGVHREAWQQMVYRVPQLKPGTVLALNLPPGFRFPEGFVISASANLIYIQELPARPTMPAIIGEILNDSTFPAITAQQTVTRYTKTVPLELDYAHLLVVSQPTPDSCLHLISSSAVLAGSEPEIVRLVAPFSHPHQVSDGAPTAQLPAALFGAGKGNAWCAIYQQADLASQRGDWQTVTRLAEAAKTNNLNPVDPFEWLPFYTAYIKQGNSAQAEIVRLRLIQDPGFIHNFCQSPIGDPDLRSGLCQ
jgi:hypothetical protein